MLHRIIVSIILLVALVGEAHPKPGFGGSRPSSGSKFGGSRPSSGTKISPSPKSPSSGWGSSASKSATKAESRKSFTQAKTPKAEYAKPVYDSKTKTTTNKVVKLDPNRASTKTLRSDRYDYGRYASRPERKQTVVYKQYYNQTPPSHWGGYSDGISPFFWMWMISQNSQSQAAYIHNHQDSLDKARIEELYAKNAALKGEVEKLKDKPQNAEYVPEGMAKDDIDLMYDDDYVAAATNFEEAEASEEGLAWYWWLLITLAIIFVTGVVVWLIAEEQF